MKYGITLADYDRMFEEQGGCCKICRRAGPGRANVGRMYVDHDHVTGEVRGLLCHDCNTAEGYVHGDPGIARRLAEYLEEHRLRYPVKEEIA